MSGRYELEHELHPGKTVLGTETYPADIENLWEKLQNIHILLAILHGQVMTISAKRSRDFPL